MHTLYVSIEDNTRVRLLLLTTPYTPDLRYELAFLRDELDRALITSAAHFPASVIRIGSRFEFVDPVLGASGIRTLCLPHEQCAMGDGLSILSRFGAAVFGCREGDEVRWSDVFTPRRVLIRRVLPADPSDDERSEPGEYAPAHQDLHYSNPDAGRNR